MEIWQVPRLMSRLMYDQIRDKDQSIFPYMRIANYTLLHVNDETDQTTEPTTKSEGTKLSEVSTTDHRNEDRNFRKLMSWSKQIRNSATKVFSALRHQRSTGDDSKDELFP